MNKGHCVTPVRKSGLQAQGSFFPRNDHIGHRGDSLFIHASSRLTELDPQGLKENSGITPKLHFVFIQLSPEMPSQHTAIS